MIAINWLCSHHLQLPAKVSDPCSPAKAKSQSWWAHADLEELRCFLKHEAQEGRYQPVFTEGL